MDNDPQSHVQPGTRSGDVQDPAEQHRVGQDVQTEPNGAGEGTDGVVTPEPAQPSQPVEQTVTTEQTPVTDDVDPDPEPSNNSGDEPDEEQQRREAAREQHHR